MQAFSQQHRTQMRLHEEKLAKKQRELDNLKLGPKKNCPICTELKDYSDQIELITELNGNLMKARQDFDGLQGQLTRANTLVAEVADCNFNLLRTKTQEFLNS